MAFQINNPYRRGSRYFRRDGRNPIGVAVDLSVTPSFPTIGAPGAPTLTGSTTGGTIPAGAHVYGLTALNARGETVLGATASVTNTGATSSNGLTWSAVTGATGYNIYRDGALVATVGAVTAYTDTGANVAGVAPPTVDTTSVIVGAIAGQVVAGDMVYRTANSGCASLNNPGTANANTASFLGVAEGSYPLYLGLGTDIGGLGRPSGDPMAVKIPVRVQGEFGFDTTPGETYKAGDVLYLGSDAQTVSKAAVGTSIGSVADDQSPVLNGGDGFGVTITGGLASGGLAQRVNVYIKPAVAV